MRSKKLILLALALLASVSVTLGYTSAANVNRRAKPKRPSGAIGAGGAGTYARGRTQRKAPTTAPTPNAPNGNASFLGGSQDGVGIRRRGNQNGAHVAPTNPTNANHNVNGNTSFVGGDDDGVGIRRRGNQNGAGVQPHDPVNANANVNANQSFLGGNTDGVGIRQKAPRKHRRP